MTERKRLYPDVHFAIEERYSAAALKQACEVDKDKARRRIERKHAEDRLSPNPPKDGLWDSP